MPLPLWYALAAFQACLVLSYILDILAQPNLSDNHAVLACQKSMINNLGTDA